MRRKAHTRRLKSGKVVQVRASFAGSPNRAAARIGLPRNKVLLPGGRGYRPGVMAVLVNGKVVWGYKGF